MTTTDRTVEIDILLAKIEKLWRRANHPNTPEAEAEAAKTKALSLMEQHRIEMGMLELDEADELGDHYYGIVKGSYGMVYLGFLNTVAKAYDCKLWFHSYGMEYHVSLTGYASDARRVKALGEFLLNDAIAQAAQFKSNSKAITKDYRRSFVMGYQTEIDKRFREAKTVAHEAAVAKVIADEAVFGRDSLEVVEVAEARVTGAEMVLAEKRERVADFMKTKHGKLRSRGHRGGRSSAGYSNGAVAGRNADLTGGRRGGVGSGTKALGR